MKPSELRTKFAEAIYAKEEDRVHRLWQKPLSAVVHKKRAHDMELWNRAFERKNEHLKSTNGYRFFQRQFKEIHEYHQKWARKLGRVLKEYEHNPAFKVNGPVGLRIGGEDELYDELIPHFKNEPSRRPVSVSLMMFTLYDKEINRIALDDTRDLESVKLELEHFEQHLPQLLVDIGAVGVRGGQHQLKFEQ